MMHFVVFAYFGPETMLPLTSVVAAVVGVFMMFGRNSIRLIRRAFLDRLTGRGKTYQVPKPHFHHAEVETRTTSDANQS